MAAREGARLDRNGLDSVGPDFGGATTPSSAASWSSAASHTAGRNTVRGRGMAQVPDTFRERSNGSIYRARKSDAGHGRSHGAPSTRQEQGARCVRLRAVSSLQRRGPAQGLLRRHAAHHDALHADYLGRQGTRPRTVRGGDRRGPRQGDAQGAPQRAEEHRRAPDAEADRARQPRRSRRAGLEAAAPIASTSARSCTCSVRS